MGGFAALSMSNATFAEAQEAMQGDVPTDPHTLDTYRAIVDAIVPRTPDLKDRDGEPLGDEHTPGGLDVELEKFIVYDFNHFQEIRLETLETATPSSGSGGNLSDRLSTEFTEMVGQDGSRLGLTEDERMPLSLFETTIDATGHANDLDAVLSLTDGVIDSDVDLDALAEVVDFGALERLDITIADAPIAPDEEGLADVELTVETVDQTYSMVSQNYRYAEVFPLVFDIVAGEMLLRGRNEDQPAPNEQFPAGGTFTRLSREDRLRALWDIVDGGVLDRLDELFSPMMPDVGILKYVVMAVNGLHGFGYYTEWSAYGDTKTDLPQERELEREPGEAQSRTQTKYPGPRDGSRANWFHAVKGGFSDDPEEYEGDLIGDDVLDGDELDGNLDDATGGPSDDTGDGEGPPGDSGAGEGPADEVTGGIDTDGAIDDALGGETL